MNVCMCVYVCIVINCNCAIEKFASVFVGNDFVAGLDRPYCMNYGCHCYGQWFGQLGDGRAITLGEVYTDQGDIR